MVPDVSQGQPYQNTFTFGTELSRNLNFYLYRVPHAFQLLYLIGEGLSRAHWIGGVWDSRDACDAYRFLAQHTANIVRQQSERNQKEFKCVY